MKTKLWKFTLRVLRDLVWRADEWIHTQEIRLRDSLAEREAKRLPARPPIGCSSASLTNRRKTTGAAPRLSAVSMGRRRQTPRMVYQHGEFVRRNT